MPRNGKRTREQLNWVVEWFDDRGFDVVFRRGAESQFGGDDKEVLIDSSPSLECQLHTLLHEAGHYLVSRREGYEKKFSHGYPASTVNMLDPKVRTDRHWVHVIHEEYEAWDEGLKLADELGIKVRLKMWERNRTSALMSYFEVALDDQEKRRNARKARAILNELYSSLPGS